MVLNLRKEKVRASSRMRGSRTMATGTKSTSSTAMVKKITRKSRRKTKRKPKYLSLRLQFSTDQKAYDRSSEIPSSTITTTSTTDDDPQHNLFPLHPENLVEEKDAPDEDMAYLFAVADGGESTLTGLLGAATTSSSDVDDINQSNTTLSPSASLTYAYGRQDSDEVALARTALRNKERELSEERWVLYSEVVEPRDDQEVSSCCLGDPRNWRDQGLSLKLDYEQILNEWSDKGSLYVHAAADCPQIVPDIHDDFLASQLSNGSRNNGGCVWRVPEMMTRSKASEQGLRLINVKEEEEQELQVEVLGREELKVGQREASVRKYKEKRHNRLFSKRIRYQVRKLNAEKRPRLKGRFVKRS